MAAQIPAEYAGSAQAQIRTFGDLEREEWQADGSWIGMLTFPAGMQNDFYEVVNKYSSGEADTRLVKDEDDIRTR
jgi:ribosome maturation protein SDO1